MSTSKHYRRLSFCFALTLLFSITYIASLTDALFRREHFDAVRLHVGQFVEAHMGNIPYTSFGYKSIDTMLEYKDGVAYVQQLGRAHPMEELFEMGKQRAEEVQAKIDGVREGGLGSAVGDYREAFRMEPPEGFDVWYKLATDLNVTSAPSLYPLAHTSVLPFLALPPAELRKRAYNITSQHGIFGMAFPPGASNVTLIGMDNTVYLKTLHKEWADLIQPHLHLFPPSPNDNQSEHVMLPIWVDDVSHHSPSYEVLSRSRDIARRGEVWDLNTLEELEQWESTKKGWGNACPGPLKAADGHASLSGVRHSNAERASFVHDPAAYMDPCLHPEHLVQNGEMITKEEWTVKGLIPLASLNTPVGGGEIIGPTSVGNAKIYPHQPWHAKTDSRIFFRGNANSAFLYPEWNWRASQRFRLSDFVQPVRPGANATEDELRADVGANVRKQGESEETRRMELLNRIATLQPKTVGVLSKDGGEDVWRRIEVDRVEEAAGAMDVSLINQNTRWPCGEYHAPYFFCLVENDDLSRKRPNCPMKPDECQPMIREYAMVNITKGIEESAKFKFRLDVDGFAWTTRWKRELSTGSVILKATLYPEWWSAQAIPWYHYIPVRYDFVDLFDIVGYFTGNHNHTSATATLGNLTSEGGAESYGTTQRRAIKDVDSTLQDVRRAEELARRDEFAQDIGTRGREFALNRLRPKDMQVYWFLLLLEPADSRIIGLYNELAGSLTIPDRQVDQLTDSTAGHGQMIDTQRHTELPPIQKLPEETCSSIHASAFPMRDRRYDKT